MWRRGEEGGCRGEERRENGRGKKGDYWATHHAIRVDTKLQTSISRSSNT